MAQEFPWSNFEPVREDPTVEYSKALEEMGRRRYTQAAQRLEWILAQPVDHGHSLGDVRQRLLEAYFHSAQLKKAEDLARGILSDHPDDGWAALALARALERQGRSEEARSPRALAAALGYSD